MVEQSERGRDRDTALSAALDILEIDHADRAAVLDELQIYADNLNADRFERKVSVKSLADQLDKVESIAANLANLVDEYESDILTALGTCVLELETRYVFTDHRDVERLRALSSAANAARGDLIRDHGSGDPDNPDRNGADLATRCDGTPKRRFVSNLVSVCAAHRPDILSTTKEGKLHQFVDLCWQWAVGDQPKGIADDLAKVVPDFQRHRDREAVRALENAARNCRRLGMVDLADELKRQAAEITDRLIRSSGTK